MDVHYLADRAGSGFWILDFGPCNDSLSPHKRFGYWILDFHLQLNSFLDLGSWILEYSSEGPMKSGSWILDLGYCPSASF